MEHIKSEVEKLSLSGKKYAIVQLCVRSTKNRNTSDWRELWQNAAIVWSYYDLFELCKEDGVPHNFNFYYSPLGVDEVFKRTKLNKKKNYVIASNGQGYLTESVRECILAATEVNKKVFHLGPKVTNKPGVEFSNEMPDSDLAKKYSECEFVSGLRRTEGFELPVIEAFACGARPIVFDMPHYRAWFNDFAIFIPEEGREKVIQSLVEIFKKGAKTVTKKEIDEVIKRFDWDKIVKGFWKKCLK